MEMARRHVAENTTRVAQQTGLVAELGQQGRDTAEARALLASLEQTLRVMSEVLVREQEREAKARLRQPRHR